jgi:hypothetical protein
MNVFLIVLTGMLIVLKVGVLQTRAAFVRLYTASKRRI